MFRFAHPYAFLLFLPLAAAAWFVYRRRVRQGLLFAPIARLPLRIATWQAAARLAAPALFLLGIAAAIVALAQPQTVFSRLWRQADAIAIEMVVDCSGSMQALDFSTREFLRSRLDMVKETFASFIRKRPDDLIGLVTFGGFASTRAPLTMDHDALLQVLKGVEIPKSAYDAGGQVINAEEFLTAIGDALATACARVEKAEVKSRIIVLLSDGESNTGLIKPEEAVKAAKTLGIRIYTIGVGSTGLAPVRVRTVFGQDIVQRMQVTLDENLLRHVAETTGGKYFNVRDPQALENALEDINKLERTHVNREVYEQYNEMFLWLLAPGVILVALGACLNVYLAKAIL